jgi:uncharacterized protein YllA (UPF0747 family)
MSQNSSKFYEELILEQTELMNKLNKPTADQKEQAQNNRNLCLINSLIKHIYKYNEYKFKKMIEPAPTLLKPEGKNKVKF